jgi:hypothetical protein
MKYPRLFLASWILVAVLSLHEAHAMELLSIQGFQLGPEGYISGFEIHTWRVRIRAVCQFPAGWMITAGRNLDQTGQIAGTASGFMTNLDVKQVGQLRNLVLIDDPPPAADKSPTEPPTFQGSATVGTYPTSKSGDRAVALTTANIILRPALACPAPIEN